ncbi:MAG: DinB family protein [Thiolinea sp.]
MNNLTEVAAVVRTLTEFFSAYDLKAADKTLKGIKVNGELDLPEFKAELLAQPTVSGMVNRFRLNPFDMENVFDLEDVLRKAIEQHPVFAGDNGEAVAGADECIAAANPLLMDASDDESSVNSPGHMPDLQQNQIITEPAVKPSRGNNNLQMLMCYLQWANHLCYQACAELPEHELSLKRPMLFDNILNLLNHVYIMQLVWQAHLLGNKHDMTSRRPADALDFNLLRSKQVELDRWYVNYTDEISAAQQTEYVDFEFIGGGAGSMTRAEILQHVANHATYHRGHIEGVFYQLGVEPPTTDLPVFLRLCADEFIVGAE